MDKLLEKYGRYILKQTGKNKPKSFAYAFYSSCLYILGSFFFYFQGGDFPGRVTFFLAGSLPSWALAYFLSKEEVFKIF